MDKINVLLVDDEFLALELLENFVKEIPNLQLIGRTKSPLEALDIINNTHVDLLFLDIQMPTLSGIHLLNSVNPKPVTIFTTAYSDYAVEAYGLDAVDYLLKPFTFERFVQAVNKAKRFLKEKAHHNRAFNETKKDNADFITIKCDSKIVKIHFGDILFVEGLKEYVRFVCHHGKFISLMSLKELTEMLPDTFLRVHKSYIVNTEKVSSLEGNLIHLQDYRIPLSRDRKKEVLKQIFKT